MSESQANLNKAPDTVEIIDLDQFVKFLTAWHTKKIATLEHLMSIPEGTEVQVGDEEQSVALTGDVLAGFKAGITVSLIELSELPFLAEMEADAPVPA